VAYFPDYVENAGNSSREFRPKQSSDFPASTLKVYANSHDPYGNFVAKHRRDMIAH